MIELSVFPKTAARQPETADVEFRQIRYALAVAKERSFTRAATRLNVSQSAISEQVKQLEARLGFALFRRTGRGVEVTDAGRAYLAEAQRVASDLISLDDVARRIKGRDRETIAVGMGSGMAPFIVPALYRSSEPGQRQPRLDIRTAPTRVVFAELFEERLDAAFAVSADAERVPSGLVSERLGEIEMVLTVASGHPLTRRKQPVDLARVFDEPLIMSEPGVGYGQIVSDLFEGLGLRPNMLSIVDNIETQLAIVRTGVGVALVPDQAAALDAAHGSMARIRVTPPPVFDLAFYRRRQPLSRTKDAVIRRISEQVRDHIAQHNRQAP
jgi:DNA-binding transcriptional LysR family regulator